MAEHEPVAVTAGKLTPSASRTLCEAVRSLALPRATTRGLTYIRTFDTWEGPVVTAGPDWSVPPPTAADVAELEAAGCVVDLGQGAFRPTPRGGRVAATFAYHDLDLPDLELDLDDVLPPPRVPALVSGPAGRSRHAPAALTAVVDALLRRDALTPADRRGLELLRVQLASLAPSLAAAFVSLVRDATVDPAESQLAGPVDFGETVD